MKKILLATTAAAIISTSSAYAMDDYYLKAEGGWSKMDKVKKAKSNNDFSFGLGAGYKIMENARVDMTFTHFVNPTFKKTNLKYKAKADALMFNGFYDVFDADMVKMFVGAGVGISKVGAKASGTAATSTVKAKNKYSAAFAGYVGAAYEVSTGVDLDLTYSYKSLGKTKQFNGHKGVEIKGHNIGAGVRFSI